MIKLIVGLGNPGPEYSATRHNAGFWLVDEIARQLGGNLRQENRFHGLAARVQFQGQDVWLLEPTTFMNRSGQAVLALAHFYKILPNEILVVHDELDILPGQVKLKKGGGSGGHNGLKDISAHLGTPDYWRLRIGIGHPGDKSQVSNFVLKAPQKAEQELIDQSIEKCMEQMSLMVEGKMEAAMMKLHTQAKKP